MSKKETALAKEGGLISALSIPIDKPDDFALSEEAKEALGRTLINMKAGVVTAVPLLCKGPSECPFISKCPIFQAHGRDMQFYNLNRQCLLEASYVRDQFLDYLQEFEFKQQDVENSPTLRSLLNKLVELDVQDFRLNVILSGAIDSFDATMLIKQNIALSEELDELGNPIPLQQLQEHPAWRMKERIQRQRTDLLDLLVATPRRIEQIKIAKKENPQSDQTAKVRALQQKVDDLLEKLME